MESPISASLGTMGPLLRKLDKLLEAPEGLLRLQLHKGAKCATLLLKDDLEEITSYLEDLSEVEDPPLTAKCWMKEVRELSYDIENYIDSFVLPGHVANTKTRSGRPRIRVRHVKITRLLETNKKLNRRKRVAARISDFRIDAREAIERHKRYELHCCASSRRVLLPAAGRLRRTYEEGAGIIIDDRMRQFMDSMADEKDEQLKVVSIVGPEGIGKTTFVKALYHKLKGQFDCRAFIRLTRKPDIKTILRDILTQVQQQQQPPHNQCNDPDLLGKIREHLKYRRYLIVIDDLWSASIWDVISYAFPGGKMGSRIITSTQNEDVALACCYYHSEFVFNMRPLDEDLSRKLFFNSLFCPENDFPQKLKNVLSKIIKICGGSPLATTIIASLSATHPVILMEQLTCIYDSLGSKLRTSSSVSEGMEVLVNFSYNNLTCCLKTCLLYLSMYPEGYTVCKDDLVKQWVAEGFIDGTEGREVETAENYFHELIGRRFLQPECIKYTSEVVSCSVPEVVRDLIAQKSLEENFVVMLGHYRRNVSLSEKVHRLSLHFPHTKYAMTTIRPSQVRSLTCFGLSKCMPSIKEFKLLRVLNLSLSGHDDDDEDIIDLTWISELLQLRYLKVASDVCIELPKYMGGLQYLETMDISKKVTDVPLDIIHLPRLFHLHLPFETNLMDWLDMTGSAAIGKPTDLQYLYLTCFIPVPDHLQRNILSILGSLFRGLGSLKTLAFILSSAHINVVAHDPSEETVTWDWDDFAPPLLERFEWLLHSCSFSRVPKWIGKLGNLCILKISVGELMRDDVNILGELPALTTLSLYVKIPPVERIIFDKAGFSVLKYFKLKCSTVPWLKFEAYAMPNLQKLKLGFSAHSHRVDQQSTVPISIEYLPGLKEISAKVAVAVSNAESMTAAVINHPRNPRIRMQLVDWNSYGHGVWYTVSKQENAHSLEEDKIPDPEEGLDDHSVPQYKDSRDNQNKEAYVRHDSEKRPRKENNTKNLESPDASTSPSILEGFVQNNSAFEPFTASKIDDDVGPHYTHGYQGGDRGCASFREGSPPYGRGGRSYGRGYGAPHGKDFINIDGQHVHRNDPINPSPREGYWICQNPNCGNLNFAGRTHCKNCNKVAYDEPRCSPPFRSYPSPPRGPPTMVGPPGGRAPAREMTRSRSPPHGWGASDLRAYAARSPKKRMGKRDKGFFREREPRDRVKFEWTTTDDYIQRELPHDGYLDRSRHHSVSSHGNSGNDLCDRSSSPTRNRPTGRGRLDDYAADLYAQNVLRYVGIQTYALTTLVAEKTSLATGGKAQIGNQTLKDGNLVLNWLDFDDSNTVSDVPADPTPYKRQKTANMISPAAMEYPPNIQRKTVHGDC